MLGITPRRTSSFRPINEFVETHKSKDIDQTVRDWFGIFLRHKKTRYRNSDIHKIVWVQRPFGCRRLAISKATERSGVHDLRRPTSLNINPIICTASLLIHVNRVQHVAA